MKNFHLASLTHDAGERTDNPAFSVSVGKRIRDFHRSFPEYSETPLVRLENTARALGLKDVYVKDESRRFGLNAFKVLGEAMPSAACWRRGWA